MRPCTLAISLAVGIAVAGLAACSGGATTAPVPQGFGAARVPDATTAKPVAYVYTTNYYSNDIGQFVFTNDGKFSPIAPNYAVANCAPDSIEIVPKKNLAFVACYNDSTVRALALTAKHPLAASTIKPVTLPAPPLTLLFPPSGAPGMLYEDDGYVSALAFTSSSLKLLKSYPSSSYPDQMAFYTGSNGASTLFVASLDQEQCGSQTVSGDVEVWGQLPSGLLTKHPAIPTCSLIYHAVVSGRMLRPSRCGRRTWGRDRSRTA